MASVKIAPIVPVTPFNVTTDSYKTFIDNVRKALAGPSPETVVGPISEVARPVLDKGTRPDKQPPRWIHVELRGEKGGAPFAPKVAIRSDDAYIIGFTNSKGRWYQLSKTGTNDRLVDDNPVMAGFDGNYTTLIGGIDKIPTSLDLRNHSVAGAAEMLWNKASLYSNDDDVDADDDEVAILLADPVKKAVATLAVAICEAARFIPVSDVIDQGWTKKERASITHKEVGYMKEWGDLSTALLNWKKKGYTDDESIFQKFEKDIKISNGEQALAVVGLVKLVIRSNMVVTTGDEQLLAYAELPKHGRYMAEVFAVRIPAAAGGDPPSGTISFHGGHCCSDFIYSLSPPKEHTSQQTCDSQGNIVLTGPSVATSAYGPIVFRLDLQDSSRGQAKEEEDEEENMGRIVCDVVGGDFSKYNRTISGTVRTGYGPTEVIYAVLSNGVQGRVEVKLARLHFQDEDDDVFLGRIVARSKLFDVGCVLFYNKADKGVRVRPGELVPLARKALAVPLHMPLTIELDLRHCSGDEIIRGQLEFKTAIDGLHTERLVSVNGAEFEVTIEWSEYPW